MEEHRERTEREEPEIQQEQAPPLACHCSGTAIVAACLAVGYGYHQQTLWPVDGTAGKDERDGRPAARANRIADRETE